MYEACYRGEREGRILVAGRAPLEELSIETVASSLELSPEQVSRTTELVNRLREQGLVVTDDPTYRLESWQTGKRLHLRLSERSYFDSVLLKQYPEWGLRSPVLAVVCVTECSDGLIVERRSQKVAALPGRLHPSPSGSVQPPDHPLETLYAEAAEELGLEARELSEVECLGLVFGELSGVYQLVVRATVSLPLSSILARACSGEWERDGFVCAPTHPEAFSSWLGSHREQLTIGGRMALLLEGERRWGSYWALEQPK